MSMAPGLVALYSGEGNALDASGNLRHGTWSGTAAYAAGRIGNALSIDGANYIDIAEVNEPAVSVFFWVFLRSFPVSFSVLIGGGNSAGANFGVESNANLRLVDSPFTNLRSANGSVALSTWMHVGYTYDGSVTRLFRDGAEIATGVGSGNVNRTLRIGRSTLETQRADAIFDEVSIWSRALPAHDIRLLHNTGRVELLR